MSANIRAYVRAVPHKRAALVVLVIMFAVGFVPLFGGLGYEHALATGLVVPSAAAVATALACSRGSERESHALGSLGRGVAVGAALAAISLLTAFVHSARVGMCDLWGALFYYAETAGIGAVMGGAWGAMVGEARAWLVVRGRLGSARKQSFFAVACALFGPLASALVSLWRFVSSPMIFAYDPFVGFFSGTLYDTIIDAGTPMLTYRKGSLATLTALALGASVFDGRERSTASSRVRAVLAGLAVLVSLGITLEGAKLGHFSTTASITRALGRQASGLRCDVVFPSSLREQEARLLIKDCDEQVRAVEKRLGAHGPERIRAFFFRDADEKKRLMGAAHTYIAKPWRHEVYLQLAAYPHPVLGHELAHVIAGAFGRGPFQIAGDVGGFLPNPGLIEGVAVMASPDDDVDLTATQWARAMMSLGLLPNVETVFSLAFLGSASQKSYTIAGAFVGFIGDTYGLEVVRAWYGGADIRRLTQNDWPSLNQAFRAHLKTRSLPPEAEIFARAKFTRPGLFARKCPHVIDALRQEADLCRDTQRYAEAERSYEAVLARDAHDFSAQKELATLLRRHSDREKGRAALTALAASPEVPQTIRDKATEALADADVIEGHFDAAAGAYDALAVRTLEEDAARTLEIKALGARNAQGSRDAVFRLLLGDEAHGVDLFSAGAALGAWNERTHSPLANYLLGRMFVGRGMYEEGATYVALALDDSAALPSHQLPLKVAREAIKVLAIAACALSDNARIDAVQRALREPLESPFDAASEGRRDHLRRFVDRCGRVP